MGRNRFLVTYDVVDDGRRTKVFRTLRNHGEHLQFSVFQCDLNAREVIALRSALGEQIHHAEDQVLLVDLGPADGTGEHRVQSVGRPYVPDTCCRII
jgi:CRISPR-associated protein Cas2